MISVATGFGLNGGYYFRQSTLGSLDITFYPSCREFQYNKAELWVMATRRNTLECVINSENWESIHSYIYHTMPMRIAPKSLISTYFCLYFPPNLNTEITRRHQSTVLCTDICNYYNLALFVRESNNLIRFTIIINRFGHGWLNSLIIVAGTSYTWIP